VRPREATTAASSGGGDAVFRPISAELPAYQGFSQQPPIVTASRWSPRPTAQGPGWGRVKKIFAWSWRVGRVAGGQLDGSVDSLAA